MENLIAIDVALLLPKEVNDWANRINHEMWEQYHFGYKFDNTHLPHISLVQVFINKKDLTKVNDTIKGSLQGYKPLALKVERVDYDPNYTAFAIGRTPELQSLHENLMTELQPYFKAGGTAEAFYQEAGGQGISGKSLEWTKDFAHKSSFEKYHPHVSLCIGWGRKFEGTVDFVVGRVANCHLGDFNSCRQILSEWRLK